jgi:hypothetical protein
MSELGDLLREKGCIVLEAKIDKVDGDVRYPEE